MAEERDTLMPLRAWAERQRIVVLTRNDLVALPPQGAFGLLLFLLRLGGRRRVGRLSEARVASKRQVPAASCGLGVIQSDRFCGEGLRLPRTAAKL